MDGTRLPRLAASLVVAASLLAPQSAPAVTTPVGPEVEVSTPVLENRPLTQAGSALAFDGTNYLLVWHNGSVGSRDVMATRLSPTGERLDRYGFFVFRGPQDDAAPAVAWNGVHFLVVWVSTTATGKIYGARVDANGTVVDTVPIPISGTAAGEFPQVASNGEDFLVVWTLSTGLDNVAGTRVSGAGQVLDPSGIQIGTNPEDDRDPAVASDGSNYIVVWMRDLATWQVTARSVSAGGTVGSEAALGNSSTNYNEGPAIAWNGASYLVAWEASVVMMGARVDQSGARIGTVFTIVASGGDAPSIASAASRFFIVHRTGGDIELAIVEANGSVTAENLPVAVLSSSTNHPAIATDGSTYISTWTDGSGASEIFGIPLTAEGDRVGDPRGIHLTPAENRMLNPAIGFDGANYLVAWEDYREGANDPDICVGRMTPSGQLLDGPGVVVLRASFRQVSPRLAFDGSNFLVTWTDFRMSTRPDIFGARIRTSGPFIELLDPTPFRISDNVLSNDAVNPDVAWGGGTFIVVYQHNVVPSQVRGVTVSSSGLVSPSFALHPATAFDREEPAVAWNGTAFLTAWQDFRTGDADIFGARVSPAGVVMDSNSISIGSGQASAQTSPALASNGTNALVVWETPTDGGEIHGVRVTPSGTILQPVIELSSIFVVPSEPAVTMAGQNYLVTWLDQRLEGNQDVFATRVGADGQVRDSEGIPIATGLLDEEGAVAAAGGGFAAFVYHRDTPIEDYKRVFRRAFDLVNTDITSGPPPFTASTEAAFTLEASEPNSTFQCALDEGIFLPCVTPVHMEVSQGAHLFLARAVDSLGNIDLTPASWSWFVDSVPPVVRFVRPVPALYVNDAEQVATPLPVLVGPTAFEVDRFDDQTNIRSFTITIKEVLTGASIPTPTVTCGPTPPTRCRFVFDPQMPGIFDIDARATNEAGLENEARIRVVAVSQVTVPAMRVHP